ncbi:MAG: hypothetical protein FWB90_05770 [Fibromonadales bacterium]|nr:hypothetical protein [Fibromonadales bacterium]
MNTTWQWPDFLRKLGISLLFLFAASNAAGIPLPGQGIAQSKGMIAGMGVGTLKSSECKTLWTWAGQGNYSYNSFLSGGASIKFLGGNLDSANNLINQRYSVNMKFTHSKPRYALFIGPIFSFENTDLKTLRKEFSNIGEDDRDIDLDTDTYCSSLYANIGSSIGYQSGGGFLLTPNWGISAGHSLDLTFSGTLITNLSGSVAFNLREQFEKLNENTKNFWLSLEYMASLSESKISHHFIFGAAVGF